MATVKFAKGYVSVKGKRGKLNENVETLQDALALAADCGPCGCDPCYGLSTHVNATTGEIMATYITGTGPYTLVIEPYQTALANAKILKAARD